MKTLSTSSLVRKVSLMITGLMYAVTISNAQEVLSPGELYVKGFEAYTAGNFKEAALKLYAYIQKNPAAMSNAADASAIKTVYEFCAARVITGASSKGDGPCYCEEVVEVPKPPLKKPSDVVGLNVPGGSVPSGSFGDLVVSRQPNGLIISTGNLYFTSHDETGAAVWRTSQVSVPGDEKILYWEAGAKFGDIVYAKTGNFYFGYFFAEKAGVITIRKVSLSGGNATVVATITGVDIMNTHHNLVTDGANLYWQDVNSIKKIPINGGEITTLDATATNTPTAGIDLQNDRIIYADIKAIRYVPVAGTTVSPLVRTITDAIKPVTTLHVGANGIYWGEREGAVRKITGGFTITLQSTGSTPVSIGTNGTKIAWAQCGGSSCLLKRSPGTSLTIKTNALGVFVSSSNKLFWGDNAGVHKRIF